MGYLMAIDAGTGSVRAVIFNDRGEQIAAAAREWTHLQEPGVADSMGFDTQHNWQLTLECIRESLERADLKGEDILALSATSMREGIVLYDAAGEAIWAVANVDARASEEVRALKKSREGIEEDFYQRSGQTFALGALPRILWLKNHHPEIYEKVAAISMIGDWILAKLCGKIATDPSNGGTTGIFSLADRRWDKEMAREAGIKEDIFVPVLEPGTPLGTITPQAAQQSGLGTQTQVVMGGGDVQLGSAGLGVVSLGDVAVLGGSFWQQVVNIPRKSPPPADMGIRVNPHVIEEFSQAEGITFFSGLVMRWFRDAFCEQEKAQAQARGVDAYTLLEEAAEQVPVGSYGILPIFSDSMKYGKWYHAAPSFLNLSLDPARCNRAAMFRSLEENACIVSAINLDKIKAFAGVSYEEIVFAGGASKGFLWPQILADVTGCRVKIPKVSEATALGAAMAAGVGAGLYPSLAAAAKELVVWARTYEPDLTHFDRYQAVKTQWQAAYETQLALVDRGLTSSMWSAPGL
jgi:autoinducer 2 (AI-2) kinase